MAQLTKLRNALICGISTRRIYARSGSVMELRGCAQSSRGSRIEVRSVAPVVSVDAPHVRLVADSGKGRYYDQRYVLVDSAGKLIQSGNYIITMTSP